MPEAVNDMPGPKLRPRRRRAALIALVLAAVLLGTSALTVLGYNELQKRRYPMKYTESVEKWAQEYKLDPLLIYAFILTESGFDPKAESAAGARGLMQMTEDTFDWIKTRIAPDEALSWDDLYQPDVAIRFGSYFVSICLQRYGGDIPTAAAAYHSGWGTVDGLMVGSEFTDDGVTLLEFPYPQMRHYVNKIDKSYSKYLSLYG